MKEKERKVKEEEYEGQYKQEGKGEEDGRTKQRV